MTSKTPLRIALVAGETSGDVLGAALILALRLQYPAIEFAGIGGPQMIAAGLDAWHQADELAVMGLVEVIRHLPRLLRLRKQLEQKLADWQPDVFIGIDAPDFNLGLERRLKRTGIKTVHYVSPSIWAWRENRAAKIGQSADRVLCLFPMEPAIYARYGIAAEFVGHPLADQFPLHPDRALARTTLAIDQSVKVLTLLPGSRQSEINRLADPFIAAAILCQQVIPGLKVIAPMANSACRAAFIESLKRYPESVSIDVLEEQSHTAMIAADAVIVASGTAALEVMLAKRPMLVGYRISGLSYWIVKTFGLIKSAWVSLPNILAGKRIVPELLQADCQPEKIANMVLPMLQSNEIQPQQLDCFETLHRELQGGGANLAATKILALVAPPKKSDLPDHDPARPK